MERCRDFQEKSIFGSISLGRNDFEASLINQCVQEFQHKHQIDLSSALSLKMHRLRTACQNAINTLSSEPEVKIEIDSLYKSIDFCTTITRRNFEILCQGLFNTVIDKVKMVVRDSNLDRHSVHAIILAGESTSIPKFKNLLTDYFDGEKIIELPNPNEAGD